MENNSQTNPKLIPRLRFKEFEDEWHLKYFKNISKIIGGGTPPTNIPEYWNGNINWFTPSEIKNLYVTESNRKITELGLKKSSATILPKDTILLTTRATIGEVSITKEECSTNQGFQSLIVNKTNSVYFVFNLLKLNKHKLIKSANGSTFSEISKKEVEKIKVAFPTLLEQQKIATFLTSVDTKTQQLTTKKQLLENYKKGAMQQLFSQQLRFKPDVIARTKDEAISQNETEFFDWEEKKLGQVSEIIGGGTPDTSKNEYWDGDIQWFTPTEIRSKFISNSKRTITQSGLKKSSAKLLPKGTILFTSRATIAELGFATQECSTNQGFQSLIVNKNNNSEFIYYLIKIYKNEFIRKSQGSTFLEISSKEMKKMKFKIPSLKEQQKIANYLSAIDIKIDNVQTQIEKTQAFKKGLLQQMFV